jgi:hypothetical protein
MTPVLLDCGHKDVFWHKPEKGDNIFCVVCAQQRTVKEVLNQKKVL